MNEEARLMPAADNKVHPLQDWREAIIMLAAGEEVVPLQDWGVALLSRYP